MVPNIYIIHIISSFNLKHCTLVSLLLARSSNTLSKFYWLYDADSIYADSIHHGDFFRTVYRREVSKVVIENLQGSVVTQIMLGGLTVYLPGANFQ